MTNPEQVHEHLRRAGISVLHVSRDPRYNNVLIVYLHGSAGDAVGGLARQACKAVPGVLDARDSDQTRDIIVLRTEPVILPPGP